MADTKERVLSYRHVEWLNVPARGASLMTCVDAAIAKRPKSDQRIIQREDQLLTLARYKIDKPDAIYLHITADTPGEAASVVPRSAIPLDEINVGTTPPPKNTEFMDGDAFVYIKGDHVCLCTTGLHDQTVHYFLTEYFKLAPLKRETTQFEFMKAADISQIKLLKKEGVKEIEMGGTISEATAHYHRRKTEAIGLVGGIGKLLKPLFGSSEHDVTEDGLRLMVTLKSDQRRNGFTLGEKRDLSG